ncbi:MAG TPA: hypothetical protein PLW65_04490 [Pseudomonadota bacterium]|nr:hypothetical protein [Pseudomonadota bacterium]
MFGWRKRNGLTTAGTRCSHGCAHRTISLEMERELKALRAEQVRGERALRAQAAQLLQLQLDKLRAEAARRRAQVRAALRTKAQIEVPT